MTAVLETALSPTVERAGRSWTTAALVLVLLVALGVRTTEITRPGYTLDEEVSYLAVQGVSATGVPSLPSGSVYQRGLPYTYAAWLSGSWFGQDILSYRLPSLVFGLLSVLLVFLLGARLLSRPSACLAAALMALSPTHVALSQWARFYSMFVAMYLLTLLLLMLSLSRQRYDLYYLVSLAVTMLLHETSIILLAILAFVWISPTGTADGRRYTQRLIIKSVVVIALVQVWLKRSFIVGEIAVLGRYGLEQEAPTYLLYPPLLLLNHATPLTFALLATVLAAAGFILWKLLRVHPAYAVATVICALFFQLGLLLLVTAVTLLVQPGCVRRNAAYGSLIALVAFVVWTIHTGMMTDAELSLPLASSLWIPALSYPFDACRWFARTWPVEAVLLLLYAGLLLARPPRTELYGLHGGLLLSVMFLFLVTGVLRDVGLKPRIFAVVLPIAYLGAGYVIEFLVQIASSRARENVGLGPRSQPRYLVVATLLSVFLCGEQLARYQHGGGLARERESGVIALQTIDAEAWARVVGEVRPDDILICSDETACQYMFGRVDYWLLVSPLDRTRWARRRGGPLRGYHSGAPVLRGLEELRALPDINGVGKSYVVLSMRTGRSQAPESAPLVEAISGDQPKDVDIRATDGLVAVRFKT